MSGGLRRIQKAEDRRQNTPGNILSIFGMFAILFWPAPAPADTLYLKSGEILNTRVERFSDGAFWVREGKKTVIVRPEEILKIVFDPETETTVTVRPAKVKPAPEQKRPGRPAILTIPPADASISPAPGGPADSATMTAEDSASRPGLAILNYNAIMNSGIFQIVGEVENRMAADARYVKITVYLIDRGGEVADQNFAYVHPDPPHLRPSEKKSFRVSFINPPSDITKYKIRVESSQF